MSEAHRGVGRSGRSLRQLAQVVQPHRSRAILDEPVEVHVHEMVVVGDGDVPRVAPDHDVRDVVAERNPVERRVGLDEPAVVLRTGPPKISKPHSVCTQVVPLLGGVEMTISPVRNRNASQRRLSVVHDR